MELSLQGSEEAWNSKGGALNQNLGHFQAMNPLYLAEYQFWAHLASTARSTLRIFLPSKGFSMHSTTIALATSADSVGPSRMTSSWTCFPRNGCYKSFFEQTRFGWPSTEVTLVCKLMPLLIKYRSTSFRWSMCVRLGH